MKYDPRAPHHERYVKGNPAPPAKLKERIEKDALTLCRALGYDLNTVEFAVEGGVPLAGPKWVEIRTPKARKKA